MFFMLSAGIGRVFLDSLGLISRPQVGLGPVRTPVEEFWCLMFPLLVRFGFWVLFSP